ncbi:MAG: hypothetical protein KatS3mg121_0680 [Gammaproteobacteria bacterium]|nr:MAG: hypothetical protein KatS3mg121_0680 [Gammaproteobacteria bacterium]
MKSMRLLRALFTTLVLAAAAACHDGGDGDRIAGDVYEALPPPASSSSSSSSSAAASQTELPLYENFGDGVFTQFDQNDTITFFSPDYKALANPDPDDPRPSLYYPTCCFFENDDPSGAITVDHQNRLGLVDDSGNAALLIGNARFTIAQRRSDLADPASGDPKRNSTPGSAGAGQSWGELDLSQDYRISFCVKDAGGAGSNFQIYVDNNTTGEANSIHGGGSSGSRIFNVPTSSLVPGERVVIDIPGETRLQAGGDPVDIKTALVGTAQSFLQFRVSSGGHVIIDDLLIEHQADAGAVSPPACTVYQPATAPAAPAAPSVLAGDGQLAVSWSAVLGATAYDVAYHDADDVGAATVVADLTETSTTLTGLSNGTTYYVWVRAKNSAGASAWSDPTTATPEAPAGCSPTTSVPPSPGNNLQWSVYDGCLAPFTPGALVVDGSTGTQFSPGGDADDFSANDDGTTRFDSRSTANGGPAAAASDTSRADYGPIVPLGSGYPKTLVLVAGIDGGAAVLDRVLEIEARLGDDDGMGNNGGDGNCGRVKLLIRDGDVRLESFDAGGSITQAVDTSGFHTYQLSVRQTGPRDATVVLYQDGVELIAATAQPGTLRSANCSENTLRIGDQGGSEYFADIDWLVWTNDDVAWGLTPAQLRGELPDGIGNLGPYALWTAEAQDLAGSGGSAPDGTLISAAADAVTFSASGGSVNSSSLRHYFVYRQVDAPFTFTARLVAVDDGGAGYTQTGSNSFRFGIAILESITPPGSGQFEDVGRFATLDYYVSDPTPTFQGSRAHKLDVGPGSSRSRSDTPAQIGDWLRIQVIDDGGVPRVIRYRSADGVNFEQLNSTLLQDANGNGYPTSWYLGLYAAPGADTLTFAFEDIEVTQP